MTAAIAVKSARARADDIDSYETEMAKARRGALLVGSLHTICQFLGFCSLTWATVVLLGGFVPFLNVPDFYAVTSLLLLQAGRLASAIFSSQLVKTALITLSQNPLRLKLDDDQSRRAWFVRLTALLGQVLFISPSIAVPIYRLIKLHHDYACNDHNNCTKNLPASLRIFYILVLSNAAVASLAVLCSTIVLRVLYDPLEQSILRYYDEVLQRSLKNGIVQADDFEFFEFAYNMLGQDFSRNVQPLAVRKHHRKLIRYLYAHRHGIDMLLLFLDWPNCFVKQAAVCMIGFWIDEKSHGLPVSTLPESLITKLVDKLGPGQVGWTAANSVDRLAKSDAALLLNSKNSRGVHVVDNLIHMIDPSTSRSLVFVRVLVSLYKSLDEMNKTENFVRNLQQKFKGRKLERKLEEMLRGSKVQRLRVLAGYLLMRMEKLKEEDHSQIGDIQPHKDSYFYKSEVDMLNDLHKKLSLPPVDWSNISIRAEDIDSSI